MVLRVLRVHLFAEVFGNGKKLKTRIVILVINDVTAFKVVGIQKTLRSLFFGSRVLERAFVRMDHLFDNQGIRMVILGIPGTVLKPVLSLVQVFVGKA